MPQKAESLPPTWNLPEDAAELWLAQLKYVFQARAMMFEKPTCMQKKHGEPTCCPHCEAWLTHDW